MTTYTATYSPEDNKIRLRASSRLDKETYDRVRAAGFIWAPKQELFVAPMWTPQRHDLAQELAGEVGDEDTSLVERAEQRSERFENYSKNRGADAANASAAVDVIAGNIPFGQPILVGHHSERRARKDAERIEAGMRKAVKMWETSEYWTQRAAGALHHAKYKELPRTRARRIKTLGADMRIHERNLKLIESQLANDHATMECPNAMPDDERNALSRIDRAPRSIAFQQRWITHYKNRIAYETAMLAEACALQLIEKKPRPKQAAIINTPEPIIMKGMYRNPDELQTPVHMTKAEYMARPDGYRGCRKTSTGLRVRVALITAAGKPAYSGCYLPVFLTDSKINKPEQ